MGCECRPIPIPTLDEFVLLHKALQAAVQAQPEMLGLLQGARRSFGWNVLGIMVPLFAMPDSLGRLFLYSQACSLMDLVVSALWLREFGWSAGNLVDMGLLAFAPATPEVLQLAAHLDKSHEFFRQSFHGVFRCSLCCSPHAVWQSSAPQRMLGRSLHVSNDVTEDHSVVR